MNTAPITAITGQTGSRLAEFLPNKGYVMHGLKRSTSVLDTEGVGQSYAELTGVEPHSTKQPLPDRDPCCAVHESGFRPSTSSGERLRKNLRWHLSAVPVPVAVK